MSYTLTPEHIVYNDSSVKCAINAICSDKGVIRINSTTCNYDGRRYKNTLQFTNGCLADKGSSSSNSWGSLASYRPQAVLLIEQSNNLV